MHPSFGHKREKVKNFQDRPASEDLKSRCNKNKDQRNTSDIRERMERRVIVRTNDRERQVSFHFILRRPFETMNINGPVVLFTTKAVVLIEAIHFQRFGIIESLFLIPWLASGWFCGQLVCSLLYANWHGWFWKSQSCNGGIEIEARGKRKLKQVLQDAMEAR